MMTATASRSKRLAVVGQSIYEGLGVTLLDSGYCIRVSFSRRQLSPFFCITQVT